MFTAGGRAFPWAVDVLVALALAAVLGTLTLSSMRGVALAGSWQVTAGCGFALLHLGVVVRHRAPAIAYGLGCLAMLVVVLVPNGRAVGSSGGSARTVDVPMLLMPSSLVFLLLLYTAAAWLPRRPRAAVLAAGLAGAVLATIRAAKPVLDVYPRGWGVPVYVAAGLVLTVLAVWSLGSFQYVRRERGAAAQAESTRLAVLEERSRIARDMHDIVAHSLAVIVRQAEGGAFAGGRAPEKAVEALKVISDTGREALADMRGLLGVLRDPSHDATPHPSLADLPGLVERVRDTGLDAGYAAEGTPFDVGKVTELAVYRVVQEALTNTMKHAGPGARVRVRLEWSADALALDVTDDGSGEGAPIPGTGAGLRGLRERVTAAGGELAVQRPEQGFSVRATFPRRRNGGTR